MAEEKVLKCPVRDDWVRGMLEILPIDLAGKLKPYQECVKPVKVE